MSSQFVMKEEFSLQGVKMWVIRRGDGRDSDRALCFDVNPEVVWRMLKAEIDFKRGRWDFL